MQLARLLPTGRWTSLEPHCMHRAHDATHEKQQRWNNQQGLVQSLEHECDICIWRPLLPVNNV